MQSSGRYVIDIEADGLYPTKIFCIVAIDYDTFKEYVFTQENVHEFTNFSKRISTWIGHNFLSYDMPALCKILHCTIYRKTVVDTLVLSRLFNPIRAGGHSLDNWGRMLGSLKLKHEDWTQYSKEMLDRCIQDTRLTMKVYSYLLNEGKEFSKRSIKLEHDTQFVLEQQKEYGFYLDKAKAAMIRVDCLSEMSSIEKEIEKEFRPQPYMLREVKPKLTKEGKLSKVGLKGFELNEVAGSFTLIDYEKFNLSSPSQVVKRMDSYGWNPIVFNKPTEQMIKRGQVVGTPQICEENIATLPDIAPKSAKRIGTYLMCKNRANLVLQWHEALRGDGRIHGTMFATGAITNRCAHINPNMGNIPSIESDKEGKHLHGIEGRFGFDCRDSFTVKDTINRRLVGVDAKAIQLRALAHYINSNDYTDAIVNGDPHEYNRQAAGLDTRARAKTFIYAFLLGAGDKKLGAIVEGTSKDGKELRERFLDRIPGLKKLRGECEDDASRGFMVGIDGRHIPVKSAHFALSSYLQGFEAVVMKAAYVSSYNAFLAQGLDAMMVAFVHDEFQTECHKSIAEEVGLIQIKAIQDTVKTFNLNCPLDGEMKIGTTWAETH